MNVVVTCEWRFFRTPDSKIWTSNAFPLSFWDRYLDVFSHVTIVARVQDVELADSSWVETTGPNVEFIGLPYYVGFVGLIKNITNIRSIIRRAAESADAVIFRVPSQTAMIAHWGWKPSDFPFALEVVGDPYDVFDAGIVNSFTDKLLGRISLKGLQSLASDCKAACYVTNEYLQRRYPTSADAISVGCSDIDLDDTDFVSTPKTFTSNACRLVFVGSFSQMYKGPDTVIEALKILKDKGMTYELTMAGGGVFLDGMKQKASELGLSGQITFLGNLPAKEVLRQLDSNDVFVMPSRTEGLPRALVEAMARSLPCIASDVGGIPELLPADCMVKSNNPISLASAIHELCSDKDKLNKEALRNFEKSQLFHRTRLTEIRREFYQSFAGQIK